MSTYKITALQKLLDDMVPASELELAHRQNNELTSKYRDLLQRENTLIAQSSATENVQVGSEVFAMEFRRCGDSHVVVGNSLSSL